MAPQIKLPDSPSPEQFERIKKPLVKAILSEYYTDGIDDLTVDMGSDGKTIAMGKFVDRRVDDGKVNNRVFEYRIWSEGSEFLCEYKPVSGNFNQPHDWIDDEDKLIQAARLRQGDPRLEFNEGEPLTDEWFEAQEKRRIATLAIELEEAGVPEAVKW